MQAAICFIRWLWVALTARANGTHLACLNRPSKSAQFQDSVPAALLLLQCLHSSFGLPAQGR